MVKNLRWLIVLAILFFYLSGCPKGIRQQGTLNVWVHAGQPSERQTIEQQVRRFNATHQDIAVKLTMLPEGSYNAQVQAAAISGGLPDLLEFDGPFVYNYVWQKNLIPLDDLISPKVRQDLLPSLLKQGTYKGRLYSLGTFDSGLGLYARRSRLQAAGIGIPANNKEAWKAEEFDRVLSALAQGDPDGQVLDLKLNYQGEWFTYAFSPIIQSAGGDLIDRRHYRSAQGRLNGQRSVAAMEQLQSWLKEGYVDPNIDDGAFTQGRVTLSWSGHWVYQDYAKAVGGDLALLPLPNFGRGSKTGQGSWNWGITTNCQDPKAAMRFLEFLLQPEEVLAMANANGAVPGTKTAIAQSPLYAEDGPLRLFASQLLEGKSIPRPQTPAYPVITSAFAQAFANIRHGLPVKTALDKAAATIDQDIQDNQGYRDI
jgi:multiple sugar transport system substrate-binding protein